MVLESSIRSRKGLRLAYLVVPPLFCRAQWRRNGCCRLTFWTFFSHRWPHNRTLTVLSMVPAATTTAVLEPTSCRPELLAWASAFADRLAAAVLAGAAIVYVSSCRDL